MKHSYVTVTDQFCGAGGSSIGAAHAGAEIRLAMNHWKLAIETHNTNFPDVDHVCTDISATDPRRYPSTDILITSPECTNHSLAKGKPRRYYERDLFGNILIDPAEERSRATMWDVPRFAEYHNYDLIIVENVVDAGKWRLWDAWLTAMHALGYDHEVVFYNSMFAWPTPQSRDRMYTVFWKRGNRRPDLDFRPLAHCQKCGRTVGGIQTWKHGRWGRYKAQYYYRCPVCAQQVTPFYYAAFNAIDWSIQAERIGDRKRPLKQKTLERIKYGLETYGRKPMVMTINEFDHRIFPVENHPLGAMMTREKWGVVSSAAVVPWLVETGYTHAPENRAKSIFESATTQTTRQTVGLVVPPSFIAEMHGTSKAAGIDEPLMCMAAGGTHHALLSPDAFLTYYYGSQNASAVTDPIHTMTGIDRAGLVGALETMTIEDLTFRMLQPHEIGKAMAFPGTYIVKGNNREKVRQYGNAVTPPVMEMIIKRCVDTLS